MLESAWLFIGVIAFLWTVATIGMALYLDPRDNFRMLSGESFVQLAGAVGTVAWGMWTFGALDVRVVGASVTYSFTMPAIAVLGIAFAIVPFFFFITGPIQLFSQARNPDVDEL